MPSRLTFFRLLGVIALAASSASLADQTLDDATFCSFESGCEAVTSSSFGKPLGIPLPALGLVGFTLVLGLSLVETSTPVKFARRLACAGALIGLLLIVIQVAVLQRICPLCLVTDGCAIAMGLLAAAPFSTTRTAMVLRAGWGVAAVIAILAPLGLALADVAVDPPDWVKAHWEEGKVTVVEVTDFECEHCRRADEYIRDVLKSRKDVKFVRIPVPMPKHANSRPSAIAFEAAKAQGRADEMAEALFAAKALTRTDCRDIAERLRLRMDEYDRAVADPATDELVSAHGAAAKAAGPGAPLIWIQSHIIYGEPTIDNFDGPFRRARPYRTK